MLLGFDLAERHGEDDVLAMDRDELVLRGLSTAVELE